MSHDLQFTIEGEDPQDMSGAMNDNNSIAPSQQPSNMSLKNSSHPVACIFHVVFKVAALTLYIFGGFITRPNSPDGHSGARFIIVTVFCVLFLAADFWVTKNVTGRLLVGLRWWNQVEGETTRWIFESRGDERSNRFDARFFWFILYVTPAIWGLLFLVGLIQLEIGWLIVVCMAISLSAANVYGYYKCSSEQKARFQQMMAQGAQRGTMMALRSNLFGMIIGSNNAQQQQQSTTYA